MKGRHERDAVEFLPLPAHFRDAGFFQIEQSLDGGAAERDDHARLDDVDLLQQVGLARFHFLRLGLATVRGDSL